MAEIHVRVSGFSENILPVICAEFIIGNQNYFPFTAELSDAITREI